MTIVSEYKPLIILEIVWISFARTEVNNCIFVPAQTNHPVFFFCNRFNLDVN